MKLLNPKIRYLSNIKDVLYDQKWARQATDSIEVYYMFRKLKQNNDLRYDITIIPFQMLGKEFVKTKGHEHLNKYAELYEVLEGRAIFLLQKRKNRNSNSSVIQDVYAVKAKKGDKVFIPPYYGHITINPGAEDLKISNWVSDKFQSDYSLFIKNQGACYYFTKRGWIKNKHYSQTPKLRFEKPNQNIPLLTASTTVI